MKYKKYDDTKEFVRYIVDKMKSDRKMYSVKRVVSDPFKYGFIWNTHRIFDDINQVMNYRKLLESCTYSKDPKWLSTTRKLHFNLFNVNTEMDIHSWLFEIKYMLESISVYNKRIYGDNVVIKYSVVFTYEKNVILENDRTIGDAIKSLLNYSTEFDNIQVNYFHEHLTGIYLSWNNQKESPIAHLIYYLKDGNKPAYVKIDKSREFKRFNYGYRYKR